MKSLKILVIAPVSLQCNHSPEGKHDDKKIIFVVFSACHFLFLYFPIFKDLTMNKDII